MNFIERISFLGSVSFEKQLALAVMSSERSYREAIKVFPKGLGQSAVFRNALDLFWDYLADKTGIRTDELDRIDKEVFRYVRDEIDLKPGEIAILFHPVVSSLARSINLTIGMIKWGEGEKPGRTSANVIEGARHIFAMIYDDNNSKRETSFRELEWLTCSINLVDKSEEPPLTYEWFLDKNPDYSRGPFSMVIDDN